WRLRRVAAFETTFVADSLEGVGEDVRQAAARHIALSGEEEPAAVRRRKTEKKLAKQRETVETWEGTLSLLRRLAELPDDTDATPVDGDDVYGVLEDVNGELPGPDAGNFDTEDPDFLMSLGVPEEELKGVWSWGGWTAGMVRRAIDRMARECNATPEKVLAKALRRPERAQAEGPAEV